MAMSGPASNSTRWQRFTAKHSAWPVLQLPEYREPHYSTTTEEPNDSTSTAIFTYWFLGDDIRDLRIQAPNVDKSQSLEHAEMVKDIIGTPPTRASLYARCADWSLNEQTRPVTSTHTC